MPVVEAVYSPWQFWDGRADSMWAQALGPVENPLEHNFTRNEVAHLVRANYRRSYEQLFGKLPDLSDADRFPLRASPIGDEAARDAWGTMTPEDRRTIDRVFANFGKTVAAFERTLRVRPTRFDRYIAGVVGEGPRATFTRSEETGLKLFIGKAQCVSCHSGPLLTNQSFANTGVPPRAGLPIDDGRLAGAKIAAKDPFNCRGAFSDALGKGCDELEFLPQNDPHQLRAYKVPSLRRVHQRPPYRHAGQLGSLEDVVSHYNRAPAAPRGTSELRPLKLNHLEQAALVAFLKTLGEEDRSNDQ
jgi:cytochrome c peroxidase